MDRINHPILPLYDSNSRILVLGSFPSVKSREAQFFYHHPQNRFWKVLSLVYEEAIPVTIKEKREFLLRNHIAVWDVIQSCEITGSSDSSIRNVIANDLTQLLDAADIRSIITNGNTAYRFYMRYIFPKTGIGAEKLPSTSPANAAYSVERLYQEWRMLRKVTDMKG